MIHSVQSFHLNCKQVIAWGDLRLRRSTRRLTRENGWLGVHTSKASAKFRAFTLSRSSSRGRALLMVICCLFKWNCGRHQHRITERRRFRSTAQRRRRWRRCGSVVSWCRFRVRVAAHGDRLIMKRFGEDDDGNRYEMCGGVWWWWCAAQFTVAKRWIAEECSPPQSAGSPLEGIQKWLPHSATARDLICLTRGMLQKIHHHMMNEFLLYWVWVHTICKNRK